MVTKNSSKAQSPQFVADHNTNKVNKIIKAELLPSRYESMPIINQSTISNLSHVI